MLALRPVFDYNQKSRKYNYLNLKLQNFFSNTRFDRIDWFGIMLKIPEKLIDEFRSTRAYFMSIKFPVV